jgi:hypothetical protein
MGHRLPVMTLAVGPKVVFKVGKPESAECPDLVGGDPARLRPEVHGALLHTQEGRGFLHRHQGLEAAGRLRVRRDHRHRGSIRSGSRIEGPGRDA